jgi:hypothetical protein
MASKEFSMDVNQLRKARFRVVASAAMLATLALASQSQGATPSGQLAAYSALAGTAPVPAKGDQFFNSTHGREWSCASCHGARPIQAGKHAATGKPIAAMAPAFNPDRFTDPAKTEKWFRRNCNDVVGRECTASEKADILGWLLSLQP